MALVSAKEMVEKAHAGHYAIPAFNINNLEWTKAVLTGIQEAKSPSILQVSEGAAKYMGGFRQFITWLQICMNPWVSLFQ